MKDRSTMDTVEFLVNVAWKEVLAFVWYKNLLFRVIPHRDVYESFHVLLIMILGSILFFVIGMRYRKDVWSATACVVLPFGFYTILTYTTTFAFFIHVVISIAVLLTFVFLYISQAKNQTRKRGCQKTSILEPDHKMYLFCFIYHGSRSDSAYGRYWMERLLWSWTDFVFRKSRRAPYGY